MMLCEICSRVRSRGLRSRFIEEYDISFAELETSAARGCELCELLHDTLLEWESESQQISLMDAKKWHLEQDHAIWPKTGQRKSLFALTTTGWEKNVLPDSTSGEVVGFYFQRVNRDFKAAYSNTFVEIPPRIFICRGTERDPNDLGLQFRSYSVDPPVALAIEWMKDCFAHHTSCPKPSEVELPTRVVDVGPADGTVQPRLLFSNGQRGQYLSLSHVWGGYKPPVLASNTIEKYKHCIPFDILPKTFQDAVTATRALGFRYVWIDSLCIIQDSSDDWERECVKMPGIYRNAVLNINASSATDCSTGFLGPRTPCHYHELRTTWPLGLGDEAHVVLASELGDYFTIDAEPHSTLSSRAWVFQERMLAPRALHFGPRKLYWNCVSADLHESTTRSMPSTPHLLPAGGWRSAEQDRDVWLRPWYAAVQGYTRCNITFDRDRLPAFSAIAQLFEKRLQDEYAAGLWRHDLARGLGWFCTLEETDGESHDVSSPTSEYLAPSWSWVSSLSAVRFPACTPQAFGMSRPADPFEVIEIHLFAPGANPYGMLSSGRVVIRGCTMEASIWASAKTRHCTIGDLEISWMPDTFKNKRWRKVEEETALVLLLGQFAMYHHAIVLQKSVKHPGCWERVGAIRGRAQLDDVEDAVVQTLTIV